MTVNVSWHAKLKKELMSLTPLERIKYASTLLYFTLGLWAFFFNTGAAFVGMILCLMGTLGLSILQWLTERGRRLIWDWIAAAFGASLILSMVIYPLHYLLLAGWIGMLEVLGMASIIPLYRLYAKTRLRTRAIWAILALMLTYPMIYSINYAATSHPPANENSEIFDKLARGTYFEFGGLVTPRGSHLIAWTLIPISLYLIYELGPLMILAAVLRLMRDAYLWISPVISRSLSWFFGKKTKEEKKEEPRQEHKTQEESDWNKYAHNDYQPPRQQRHNPSLTEAYEFFGLKDDCSEAEFKVKFREKLKAVHPDGKPETMKDAYNDLAKLLNRHATTIKSNRGWL